MMRMYIPDYSELGISKSRYRELVNFCHQYQEWKAEAASLLGVGAQQYSTMPHSTDPGDPVGRAVIRRERLLDKCALVERVADSVDGGQWRAALIQNVCMGKALYAIDPVILPTSKRNTFYQQRRQFFALLHAELENRYSRGSDLGL